MEADELIKQGTVPETDFHQISLSEVKSNETQHDGISAPEVLVFLGPFCFIISWAVLFFMLSKIGRGATNEILLNMKPLKQVPCKNCRFFCNNAYLKCAVQPSLVLTPKAIDCSDYKARERKFP
jgi:hypothetical protein